MVLGKFFLRMKWLWWCKAHSVCRESLGNKGWGWEGKCSLLMTVLAIADNVAGLAPYFKKSQTYDPPQKEHSNKQFMPIAAKDEYHGTNGPIHTSFNDYWEVRLPPWRPAAQSFANDD